MKVERVGPDQAGALARLHAAAFDPAWPEAEMAELLRGAGSMALALEAGFILIRVLPPEAEVITLAVAPEARRRGMGRALLRAALDAAEAAGAEAIFLEVAADNQPALALYAGEGFGEVGRRRGYYPRPCGAGADALLLRRTLPSPSP